MSEVAVRVATQNTKGGLTRSGLNAGGRRLGLGPADERILAACRRAHDDAGATVLVTQETSGLQVGAASRLRWWDVTAGVPNVTAGNGATIGNAVWHRKDVWRLVSFEDVAVHVGKVVSRYVIPETLHFPAVVLRHRETDALLRVVCIHFPAGRTKSAQAAKRQCAREVTARYAADPIPTVYAGDRNRAGLLDALSHAEHGVDFIGSVDLLVDSPVVDDGAVGLVSDHAGLSARVLLPVPAPVPVTHACTYVLPDGSVCGDEHLPPA